MQQLVQISLVVNDYDEAINYYTQKLNFQLMEDTALTAQKRWVVIQPKGAQNSCTLLLAKAATDEQRLHIGNQTGGRVFLFLHTDNIVRDFTDYTNKGVEFLRPIQEEAYGRVTVFKDMYGNLWDLIEPKVRS